VLSFLINMIVGEVAEISLDLVRDVAVIGLWLKAVGVIVILWIIFNVVNLIVNRKKRKALYRLEGDLKRIEKKVNRLLRK
jgi:hypothetical protein